MTDLWPVARALADHLAAARGLVIVEPSHPARVALVAGAGWALRLAGIDAADILERLDRTSVCLPLGIGQRSLVIVSEAATSDAITYASTVAHEAHHDQQSDDEGHVRGSLAYLALAEVRAKREADAYAVGLWVRYLLAGEPPGDHEALLSLTVGPYHLGPGELALARGLLLSHLASIRAGACPPISTAREVLTWLQQHHPEGIVPEHLRRAA